MPWTERHPNRSVSTDPSAGASIGTAVKIIVTYDRFVLAVSPSNRSWTMAKATTAHTPAQNPWIRRENANSDTRACQRARDAGDGEAGQSRQQCRASPLSVGQGTAAKLAYREANHEERQGEAGDGAGAVTFPKRPEAMAGLVRSD